MTSPVAGPPSTAPAVPQRPNAPRPMFSALAIAESGLSAQRVRMDVIAQNIANAETTHTAQGGPYQRRVVTLAAIDPQVAAGATTPATSASSNASASANASANATSATATSPTSAASAPRGTTATPNAPAVSAAGAAAATTPAGPSANVAPGSDTDATGGVRVASIGVDQTPGALIYDPGNPDADASGYVRMPNVNMTDELMDLMNARRVYEANATVFEVARAMLHTAIDI